MTLRLCFYNDCLVCERLNRHLKRRGFSRPARLRHVKISITKWFSSIGSCETSSFCPFGKVVRVLLAQTVLGSDYI